MIFLHHVHCLEVIRNHSPGPPRILSPTRARGGSLVRQRAPHPPSPPTPPASGEGSVSGGGHARAPLSFAPRRYSFNLTGFYQKADPPSTSIGGGCPPDWERVPWPLPLLRRAPLPRGSRPDWDYRPAESARTGHWIASACRRPRR